MKSNIQKKILTMIFAVALGASAGSAGNPGGLHVVKGQGGVEWPPVNTTPMARVEDGDFHTALLSLDEGEHFVIADYDSGLTVPSLLGPGEHTDCSAEGNNVYWFAGKAGVLTPVREQISTSATPSMSAFDLWTDKARYEPGQEVRFSVFTDNVDNYRGATIRYRYGMRILKEEPLESGTWSWTPPAEDFRGYLVDIYRLDAEGREEILGSIAVDVSSDYKRFPRNGYTAWYGSSKLGSVWDDVAFLNRRHINVVQFQDWHWRHHRPYCADALYTDIANNEVSIDVVREMIKAQHAYGMKSLFYNLGYGALGQDHAEEDGVQEAWYYFLDPDHGRKDYHDLLSIGWKSNIDFLDPGNTAWQNYLCDRNEEVYSNLDFDGFQVDQVGSRGDNGYVYDYYGNRFRLCDHFAPLLKAFKQRHPEKSLIMNSVSRFGEREIASSGVIDVCYNEMWDDGDMYNDIYSIIRSNKEASGNPRMKTIFANYMNYGYDMEGASDVIGNRHEFNVPGVLLTDACIFALGGAHLQLGTGQNMLCKEYFPNTTLRITDELRDRITRYYDFATAYENFLYDTTDEYSPQISAATGQKVSLWNWQKGPLLGNVVVHGKLTEQGEHVLHLLNFIKANSLSWRDFSGTMPAPEIQSELTLNIDCDYVATNVWAATPDSNACTPRRLEFTQKGRLLTVTVPSLEYWTMLVIE